MFRKTQPKPYSKPERAVVPYNPETNEIPPFIVEDVDEKLDTQYWNDHGLSRERLFGWIEQKFINPIWTGNDPNHPYAKALERTIPPFRDRGCKMAVILSNDNSVGITLKHDFSQILSARKNAVELRYTIENLPSIKTDYASPRRKNRNRQNYILCSMDLIGRWNRDKDASVPSLAKYCKKISEHSSTKEHAKFFCLFEKRIYVKGSKLPHNKPSTSNNNKLAPFSFLTNLFKTSSPSTSKDSVSSDAGPFKNLPHDVLFALISYLDPNSFAKLMQANKFFAQVCQDEKAFKAQCQTHFQLPQEIPTEFNSWKECFHHLVAYHYVRLVATLNKKKNDFEYLIVDVNLNPYRKIAVHAFPDWMKDNQEVKEFLAARPGYID